MSRDRIAVIVAEMRSVANNYGSPPPLERGASVEIAAWADRLAALTREAAPQASDAADLLSKESCLLVNGQPRFRTMPDSATLQDYLDKLCIGMLTPVDQMALDNMLHDRLAATDSAQRRCTNPACGGRGYEDAWDLDGNWTGTACDECAAIMASPEPTDSAQAIQSQQGATGGAVLDEIYRRYTEMIAADWDRCERVDAIKETLLSLIEFALAHPQAAGSASGEGREAVAWAMRSPRGTIADVVWSVEERDGYIGEGWSVEMPLFPPSEGSVASGAGDAEWLADVRRCLEDVSTEMRARGRGDERFQRLIQRMPRPAAGAGSAPVGGEGSNPATIHALETKLNERNEELKALRKIAFKARGMSDALVLIAAGGICAATMQRHAKQALAATPADYEPAADCLAPWRFLHAADTARLDYIERTFSGMTNRERYLPVQMIWGKGCNGRSLREACDKYMKRDAALSLASTNERAE